MSTDKVQLGGLDIPKGTAVIVPVMSIHQDQKIWEDPENFKPERYKSSNWGDITRFYEHYRLP